MEPDFVILEDDEPPIPGMLEFRYRWTYRLTGNTGVRRIACDSTEHFLRLLNHWNASQVPSRNLWQYEQVTCGPS